MLSHSLAQIISPLGERHTTSEPLSHLKGRVVAVVIGVVVIAVGVTVVVGAVLVVAQFLSSVPS